MPNLLEQIQRRTLEEHGLTPDERGHYVMTLPEVPVIVKRLSPEEVIANREVRGEKAPVIEGVVNPMLLPDIGYIPKALQFISKTRYVAPIINWGKRVITSRPARILGEAIDTAFSPRNWIRSLGWSAKKVGLEGVGSAILKAEPVITSGYWGYGLIDDITHPEETSWWEYPLDAMFTAGSAKRAIRGVRSGNYSAIPLTIGGMFMNNQHLLPVEFVLDHLPKDELTDEEILDELSRYYGTGE